jgi:hypothetical protein
MSMVRGSAFVRWVSGWVVIGRVMVGGESDAWLLVLMDGVHAGGRVTACRRLHSLEFVLFGAILPSKD